MDLTVIHDDNVCRFEVFESGQIAYLQYKEENYVLDILQIVVPAQLEGFGISSHLIVSAMRYAYRRHLKIKASAEQAKEYFLRHPEYKCVLI